MARTKFIMEDFNGYEQIYMSKDCSQNWEVYEIIATLVETINVCHKVNFSINGGYNHGARESIYRLSHSDTEDGRTIEHEHYLQCLDEISQVLDKKWAFYKVSNFSKMGFAVLKGESFSFRCGDVWVDEKDFNEQGDDDYIVVAENEIDGDKNVPSKEFSKHQIVKKSKFTKDWKTCLDFYLEVLEGQLEDCRSNNFKSDSISEEDILKEIESTKEKIKLLSKDS